MDFWDENAGDKAKKGMMVTKGRMKAAKVHGFCNWVKAKVCGFWISEYFGEHEDECFSMKKKKMEKHEQQ